MRFESWLSLRRAEAPAGYPDSLAPFDDGLVELARLIAVDDPVKASTPNARRLRPLRIDCRAPRAAL